MLVNDAWRRTLGWEPGELVGSCWSEFVHPADVASTDRETAAVVQGSPVLHFTNRWRAKDGSYRVLAWSGVADASQQLVYATARDITEQERAERVLRTYQARLGAIVDRAPIVVWATDRHGNFTLSVGRVEPLGHGPNELVGRSVFDVYGELTDVTDAHRRALAGEKLARTINAGDRWYEANYAPLLDADGEVEGVIGVAIDVTARRRAELELRESEARYRHLVETSRDLIWALDRDCRFTFVNQAACRVLGHEPAEMLGHRLVEFVAPEMRDHVSALLRRSLSAHPLRDLEADFVRRDGGCVTLLLSALALTDPVGDFVGMTGTATDVTDRRRFEAELRRVADHDVLTGLFNRRRFEEELDHEIAAHGRHDRDGAVLVLDLDNMKYVNDTLGHAIGDELLVNVAHLLESRLRESDVCARLGGDEFAVLLPWTELPSAERVARDLLEGIREKSFVREGRRVRASASLGITTFGGRHVTGREVLAEADLAMYDAKESGRDRAAVHSPAGQARLRASARWAERIRDALEDDGFVLEAQPILDLATGEVSHRELLLRMRADDGSLVPPGAFLTSAERFGLITAIDRWVTGRAIELVRRHAASGGSPNACIEVNLSARSFGDRDLLGLLERRLAEGDVPPQMLVFEITETEAIANMDAALDFARTLRALGCGFALDDFGTGFGSFHYLKYLPLDYVKIDGDFVRDLTASDNDRLMVKAIVEVAQGMGMKTVAEWVQDEQTLTELRKLGVDYAQGYYVGEPELVSSS